MEDFQKMGYEKNVVILTREARYEKKAEVPWLSKLVYRKYPAFSKVLQNRHNHYNETTRKLEQMEKDGSVLIIRPENPLNIGRLENNPEKIQEIYDIRYRDGMKWVEKVKEFID